MKNIYTLPTNKPSKKSDVVIWNGLKIWDGVGVQPHHNQNIYITSDEEIKEWYIYEDRLLRASVNHSKYEIFYGKPVILTTDQDLIKDGVQAIDDEFLKWFVKNTSCEEVEIIKEKYILQHLFKSQEYRFRYKINVPKKYKVMIVGSEKQSLGKALVNSMKSFSQKEGGLKNEEVNLPIHKIIIPKEELKHTIVKETCIQYDGTGETTHPQTYNNQRVCNICNGKGDWSKKTLVKEEPKQYPIGGYAPGFYSCTCVICKTKFQGDKRAVQCKPCATKITQEESKSLIEKMKQWQKDMDKSLKETLKEAMKQNGYSDTPSDELWREGVEFGANWQAERMYSEEDMINASKYGYNFHKTTLFPNQKFEDSCINNTKQWLTIFKKIVFN